MAVSQTGIHVKVTEPKVLSASHAAWNWWKRCESTTHPKHSYLSSNVGD